MISTLVGYIHPGLRCLTSFADLDALKMVDDAYMDSTVNGSRRVALALVYFVCRGRAWGSVNCVGIYIDR